MRANLSGCGDRGSGAGRLCLAAVDALYRRHAAACPRSGHTGRRAGQAGAVSRDLLRGARSTQERASRLSLVRRRAHPRGGRAGRHGQASHPGAIAPTASSLSWCRASDTTASSTGWRHPALPLRTCAHTATISRCIPVEGLSSTTRNARLIRDALMSMPTEARPPAHRAHRLFEGFERHPGSARGLPGAAPARGRRT